ncbi:low specificity L-threonine aldolase [Cereibacter changlensis JA139]|uniref:L-threonine aldolase n=2 Tax=Cereibacter changlensis TaxID=402884 RepID=A0A2T4JZC8_9RHOB|nr:beta-eliminating lyase-related protein [Cereibacter changlensis]PTE23258.1 low specificity L-threonine aldolase [Cereibacter changlensis JA139]PZX55098.1 L-threonine aldolase [Cereibacter changlensis]
MFFASDNASAVPPQVMAALNAANEGFAMPYGRDPIMTQVRDRIREIFEAPEAAVYLVATGTAANSLALATLCEPWSATFCHSAAHIQMDECGAPEFYGSGKLVLVEGAHGKIDPVALDAAIRTASGGGVHGVQPAALSLTNVTEAGTVYSPAEVARLCAIAKAQGLACHMDGARFANALVAAGCSPAEMTWKAGIDVLSFGGTKNGLMGVEAVVLFDPQKAWEFELRRKRGAHLFSKHRYLSAQMQGYLQDDLWLDLAARANAAAARLADGLAAAGATLLHPVDANMIFATLPRAAHERAQAAGAVYYPMAETPDGVTARLVCSWSTTEADVDAFLGALAAPSA